MEIPSWVKYFADVPILWIFFWMTQRFVKVQILDAIQDAKHSASRAETAANMVSEKITELKEKVSGDVVGLKEKVSQDTQHMAKLFAECVSLATKANSNAEQSVNGLKEMNRLSEERMNKVAAGAGKIIRRVVDVETQIKEIRKDLFRVGEKKNGSTESDE